MIETIKNILTTVIEFFKRLLTENKAELLLFVITFALLVIIIDLIIHSVIQNKVKNESRCYKDKLFNRPGIGKYNASGYGTNGKEIFKITYDFSAKTYTIEQKCRKGSVINTIEIPIYDIATLTQSIVIKNFECEENFDVNNSGIIYKGYPGIVKFMQYNNTDFFDSMQDYS